MIEIITASKFRRRGMKNLGREYAPNRNFVEFGHHIHFDHNRKLGIAILVNIISQNL
ncbi:hypothetical protein [Candidatus Harpocratesius sp.]